MKKRNLYIVAGVVVIAAIVAGAVVAYNLFFAGESEASVDIEEKAREEQLTTESEEELIFRIVPDESEVRFNVDEELRGQPKRVVGTTDQVGGDIAINMATPQTSRVGNITINLRTLQTDDENRDRAIRGDSILKSGQDEYEFTSFRPTSVEGLPETVAVGESFSFQVTGDLKLVDTTRSVTFDVEVNPVSETRIEGYGSTTVSRADYNLDFPTPPIVANVADEVLLEIDFVAELVEGAEFEAGAEAEEADGS